MQSAQSQNIIWSINVYPLDAKLSSSGPNSKLAVAKIAGR